jgi:hypothetical protein
MYKHQHVYIYQFEIKNHSTWQGMHTCTMKYSLCTDITGPAHKQNKLLLEQMLRTVYGHMPKNVKFIQEKLQ